MDISITICFHADAVGGSMFSMRRIKQKKSFLLLADNACDYSSAVAAAVVFRYSSNYRRAAARAAVFYDLFGERDTQLAAVFFGRTAAKIALLYSLDYVLIPRFGRYGAERILRLLHLVVLLQV